MCRCRKRLFSDQVPIQGSTFGTWYDRPIYPGYYDTYGAFNACWGYNSEEGFICLAAENMVLSDEVAYELDNREAVYWDADIFGTQPDTWSNFTINGFITAVDQDDLCDSRYSSSCYNQYDACMEVLNGQQVRRWHDNLYGGPIPINRETYTEICPCRRRPLAMKVAVTVCIWNSCYAVPESVKI